MRDSTVFFDKSCELSREVFPDGCADGAAETCLLCTRIQAVLTAHCRLEETTSYLQLSVNALQSNSYIVTMVRYVQILPAMKD